MDRIHPIVPRQPDVVPVEPVRRAWIDPETRERRREERAREERERAQRARAAAARPRDDATAAKRGEGGDPASGDGPHVDVRA